MESDVVPVGHWHLGLVREARWAYAEQRAEAIAAYWVRRKAENPALFNGRVMMCLDWKLAGTTFIARLMATDFANFLYWRSRGDEDRTVYDAFGSALVWSRDGSILLAEPGAHTINAGNLYLPGGFIDERDVAANDTIDIDASIARELFEETGLAAPAVQQRPGGLVVRAGQLLSLVGQFDAPHQARDELRAHVEGHMRSETEPELARIVMHDPEADAPQQRMPAYVPPLLAYLRPMCR
jgi:ADP-ribose pyrophosphatase YjhB (NUDIX family)